jgi:fluoroquinolone transport system permease protein
MDAWSVGRDRLLRWTAVLTPAVGLLYRFAVPVIGDALRERFGFDLTPYYPLVASFLPLMATAMIGTVIGFLLLDQRDEGTLAALLVTPLSLGAYLRYRLGTLLAAAILLSAIAPPLGGLTATTPAQLVVTAATAAPLAAIQALFLGSFARNKVQGFALSKAAGVIFVPCLAAWFVAEPWQLLIGLIPHYWALKVFWLFDQGEAGRALAFAGAGLAWQGLLVVLLARHFGRVVRR